MKKSLSAFTLATALCLALVSAQSKSEAITRTFVNTHNLGDLPPEIGVSYCQDIGAFRNTGELHAFGSAVATDNMLNLSVVGIPANSVGYFLVGETRALVFNPAGSQGDLCIGGRIGRFNKSHQVLNAGSSGGYDLWIDLTDLPVNPSQVAMAGETWCFQSWYRIPGAPTVDNSDSDFTNAVEILFQ